MVQRGQKECPPPFSAAEAQDRTTVNLSFVIYLNTVRISTQFSTGFSSFNGSTQPRSVSCLAAQVKVSIEIEAVVGMTSATL